MSDILIRNMEMPKCCWDCPLINTSPCPCKGYSTALEHTTNRHPDCHLIPVPPHVDLLSREWLVDIGLHLMNTAKNDDIANGVKWLLQYIIDAPSIIPVDKDINVLGKEEG